MASEMQINAEAFSPVLLLPFFSFLSTDYYV